MYTPSKKGTPVYLFRNFDSNGTWVCEEAIVYSWGANQAYLQLGSDKMARECFLNRHLNSSSNAPHVFPRTEINPQVKGLELAIAYLAAQRAHFGVCLASCQEPHYQANIRDSIECLHEPCVKMQAWK